QLSKRYGDIFGISMGSTKVVIVNGMRLVKEVLVNQGEDFLERPEIPIDKDIFSKMGLISSSGHLWKAQRRFTLTTLRNFGLGKRSVEERIQEECRFLVDAFKDEQADLFAPTPALQHCSIAGCSSFDIRRAFQCFIQVLVLLLCPQLYNSFPSIMKFLPGAHQTIFKNWQWLQSYMKEQISKHKEDWNPSESRDYIDSYLQEIAKDKSSDTFREEHLIACTLDLFFAGTETTSSTLRWALLFMALHPEIQGTSSKRSVYFLAFIPHSFVREIFLVRKVGNLPAFTQKRVTRSGTSWTGHWAPLGAVLSTLQWVLTGQLGSGRTFPQCRLPGLMVPKELSNMWVAVSAGKRACLGELLARSELFLFFTSLLQKFTFQPPLDTTLSLQPVMGITMAPQPYKICAVPR
ncbi:CP2J2 protein, partial [Sakesphorus luctuosus]|nr:CP2J2 protein [Sakesphorus luctuosus]